MVVAPQLAAITAKNTETLVTLTKKAIVCLQKT
jgi:hypothetical protein